MIRVVRSLLAAKAACSFAILTSVVSAAGLLAEPAQAATVQSAGFTSVGTFEVVLQDDIFANTSGGITVNAPVGPGVMGVNFLLITPGFFTNTVNPSLLEGTSLTRTYSNPSPSDGTVTVALAWLDSAWELFSAWSTISDSDRAVFLDDLIAPAGGTSGLFEIACDIGCASTGGDGGTGGDDTGGGTDVSPVPLPAAGWFFFVALAGLGVAARSRKVA